MLAMRINVEDSTGANPFLKDKRGRSPLVPRPASFMLVHLEAKAAAADCGAPAHPPAQRNLAAACTAGSLLPMPPLTRLSLLLCRRVPLSPAMSSPLPLFSAR